MTQLRALGWRRPLAVVAGYLAIAALFSWPLPRQLGTHLPGHPAGDTGVYVWNLWVFQHEVLDHRTMPYFTDEIFAATGRANLSLHNYTAFANILALPFVRLLGVVTTFNLVYTAMAVLAACAMFLLAFRLTGGDTGVAWLAGVLFAWSPVLVTRGMGHYSLVAAAPLPIFVLLLVQARTGRFRHDALVLGATVAWATACDVYYGVFCVMLATAYLTATSLRLIRSQPTLTPARHVFLRAVDVLTISMAGLVLALMLSQGWQFTLMGQVVRIRTVYTPLLLLTLLVAVRLTLHFRPTIRPVSGAQILESVRVFAGTGVVSAILISPLLYAYGVRMMDSRTVNPPLFWRSSPPGVDLLALVAPNPNHPLAPVALREWLTSLTRDGYLENVASIPIVAVMIILVAWRVGWRPPLIAAAIAIGFGVLALGPFIRFAGIDTHVPAPWAFLRYLPVVGLVRSPSRFLVIAMVGVAVLFATAMFTLVTRWPAARRPLLAGIGLLLVFELLPAPRTLFSAEIPSFYRIVASDPREEVRLLELPFGIRDGTMARGNFTARSQFYQTAHQKPILGGYLSRVSERRIRDNERHPVLSALLRLSEGQPLSPRQAEDLRVLWPAFVRQMSIGYVVLDRERAARELQSMAVPLLQLEELASHGALTLYRPAIELGP